VKAYYLQYEEEAQMRLMAEVNGFEMVRFCAYRAVFVLFYKKNKTIMSMLKMGMACSL
jgi:hypothetical protein